MDISGASAIVTGGASGLGEATAQLLAERGAKVVIADLAPPGGEGQGRRSPTTGGVFVACDVTDPTRSSPPSRRPRSSARCGCSSTAPASAGRSGRSARTVSTASAHDLDIFTKVIQINLIGTFNCIRLAATAMSQTEPLDEFGERGAIVNTASVAAYDGQIGQAAYSASKGGVVGMTLPIARDLAAVGIRVNTIAPGFIDTPIYGTGESVGGLQGEAGAEPALPEPLRLRRGVRQPRRRAGDQQLHERREHPLRRRRAGCRRSRQSGRSSSEEARRASDSCGCAKRWPSDWRTAGTTRWLGNRSSSANARSEQQPRPEPRDSKHGRAAERRARAPW